MRMAWGNFGSTKASTQIKKRIIPNGLLVYRDSKYYFLLLVDYAKLFKFN